MPQDLPYREFYYPLNVFMYVLSHEEGVVRYLHYGLFESERESIGTAQERSTDLLLARLPPPPARILEAGIGVGTTLARLTRSGYDATGITPDPKQAAIVHERYGDELRVHCHAFEDFEEDGAYDCVLFQESAQYIDAEALFARARELTPYVVVADEFALRPIETPGALHTYERFLAAAASYGFHLEEEVDLSARAAPTIDYFLTRLPMYREALVADLALTPEQIDELLASGTTYRELYRAGTYGYRLLALRRD
ncbi:MAG TPA: class I SAM-dependent methyltransferase [Thermoanaerobaculia bacterium]|nr:class I SAM-dependent methyltransferase [Thermoanaerobaculia bacterium]